MGLGTSIFLIAVGAILEWGITAQNSDINVNAIGVILMVVGIFGAALSLFFWESWGGFGAWTTRRTEVYDRRVAPVAPVVTETPLYRDDIVVETPVVYEQRRPRRIVEEVRRERY